jgi:phage regulator Rha-like protein
MNGSTKTISLNEFLSKLPPFSKAGDEAPLDHLVFLRDGKAVTSTLALAKGTEVQHKNVLELVRAHLDDLTEFGWVAFETRPFDTPGGVQQREIAILDEAQSTFLITLMRNTEVVVRFKKALVKAFYEIKAAVGAAGESDLLRALLAAKNETIAAQKAHLAALEASRPPAPKPPAAKPRRRHFSPPGWKPGMRGDRNEALRLLNQAIADDPGGRSGVARKLGCSYCYLTRILSENDPKEISNRLAWHILNTFQEANGTLSLL